MTPTSYLNPAICDERDACQGMTSVMPQVAKNQCGFSR
jgi:hypothetical protein